MLLNTKNNHTKILLSLLIIIGYNTNNCKAEGPNVIPSVNTLSNNLQINTSKVANSTQPQIRYYNKNNELVTSLSNLDEKTENAKNMINKIFSPYMKNFSEKAKNVINATLSYQFEMLISLAQTLKNICHDLNNQKMVIINILQEYERWLNDLNNVRFTVELNNNETDDLKNKYSEQLHIWCKTYCQSLYYEINKIKQLLGI